MRVLIFDTETAGVNTQTLVNVGYKIIDLIPPATEGKTLCQHDYIVKDIIKNKLFMINDTFVGVEKFQKMQGCIKAKTAEIKTLKYIFKRLAKDIRRYEVTAAYAYNIAFDIDKFVKHSEEHKIHNPFENIPFFDIWGMAYQFICLTDKYRQFCLANNLYTKSGKYLKTSVESVTAFLTNNPAFVEDHTALSDVFWETKILLECAERGANLFENYKHGFLPAPKKEVLLSDEAKQVLLAIVQKLGLI